MRLDRLLREEETRADLAVHETVGNELKHLELAAGGLLLDTKRRAKWNDFAAGRSGPTLSNFLETSRVVDITTQDFSSLGSVHGPGYRPSTTPSSPSIQGLPSNPDA